MNVNGVNNQKTLVTPIWVLATRIAQVVLSIVILGMAATWSEYALFDGPSLAIAAAVFTWLIVAYILVTEKVAAANPFYTIYAVIALDAFMVVIWLSTWALNAARRAALGNIGSGGVGGHGQSCYDGYCVNYKRDIAPRSITFSTLGGLLAGVAALGAIVWVSFIVTLVWTIMNFLKGRKEGRFTLGSQSTATADHNMEEQKAQQPVQPQYAAQQQLAQPQEQQPYAQYPQQPVEGQYQQPQYTHDPSHPAPQQHQ